LLELFTNYVRTHKDFEALEEMPTLYHKVEVLPFPQYDSIEIYVTTRTFEKVGEKEKVLTLGSHMWGFHVTHTQWDTVEKTKAKIDERLAKLRHLVATEAYYPGKKIVSWAREQRLKCHATRWVVGGD
jgi:hypothetical protein